MEFVTILLGFFLLYALIQATFSVFAIGRPKTLPPGPTPFPIIGNLHLLGDQPHQSLANLAKTHGPIMFLKLGHINTLVISSAAAAKQVLRKQDLSFSTTRHIPDALHAHHHSINSSVWMPIGAQWRTLRKILNNNIFSGDSLDANQHLRNKKVEELVAYCQEASRRGEPVDIGRAGFRTSLNLLSNTVFSKDLTDPFEDSGREFKEVFGKIMVEAGKPNLVDFFPVLKKMDPQGIRRRMSDHFGKVLEMFEVLIEERLVMKKRLKKDDDFDDVLDRCLRICEEIPDEVNRSHIMSLFLDVFVAGTDTTSNTLEWAMTEVLLKPNIMAKAKEELEAVIGKGKIVEENDLSRLPYLSCIVKETLRLHAPIPFLIPRKVVNEVKLNEYIVPKGTQVLVNAWAIGRDPSIWEDSLEFKPERFQTSRLDVQGQDFELIPFGAGRRICPGLPLAIRMIPMMLGSLLNNFDWSLNTGIKHEELDMAERFGITLQKLNPLCVIPMPLLSIN
ncbi:hypothetical protein L6452_44360 [Arctium lappa]|uniref:Uncharacterized protein n=1 Tax=Arctium lappa TaxID=4217 RepID=A0ACB8XGN1_ARCLA|nr:hypothetical protein L6452_44360 [Arctium lappa]